MHRNVATFVTLFVVLGSALNAKAADRLDPSSVEFFETNVRPLLANHCLSCHGPDRQKGGLRLDSRDAFLRGGESGPAMAPGDPEASLVVKAVGYEGETQMPPRGKLEDQAIQSLTRWVKMGAPWPESPVRASATSASPAPAETRPDPKDHWAFRPVKVPVVPEVKDREWPKGTIDRFILSRLESRQLRPVEPADRRTLIRRASFDLTGLPPTPEEVDAFVNDSAPDAFDRVVDRLLASPHYGERWGRHWLDVARYGEDQAHTFEARTYPNGYRYRDWVVKALNDDMPYDRFVVEQIAGDLVDGPGTGRDDRLAALGFFALGPHYYGNAVADELDDRVDTFSRGFLGLTVACARCHDHKFDPIPTKDYYSLSGVFASTVYQEYPDAPREVVEAYERGQARIKNRTAEVDQFLALSSFRLFYVVPKKQVEAWLPRSLRPRLKALRQSLAQAKADAPAPYPVIHALKDAEKPADLQIHIRGNPKNLGEVAPRRFLSVLSPGDATPFTQGSGRRELAQAVVSPDNPLTARVIVNRVWEHHFGQGLVTTPSNFGTLGAAPTHPELLDYLADRFLKLGWSLKALHREIMRSATYQLSSRIDPTNQEVDAEDTLLWRMNRRRLEVESWRDAMLAVTGNLDRTLGGPSLKLVSSNNRRRTFYAAVSRHDLDSLLRLFDFPDPNITCDRRAVTAVPLQQLFVLNSDFMVRQARALAARLTADPSEPDAARIRRAFPLLYGRPADNDEVAWGLEFLNAVPSPTTPSSAADHASEKTSLSAWDQFAQILLGSNEFMFVD